MTVISDGSATARHDLLWVLAALILFSVLLGLAWQFTIDDAYISAVYARNLATGRGFTYASNPEPSEGFSNLLSVLLTSALALLGVEAITAAKILAAVFGYATVIGVYFCGRLLLPRHAALLPLLVASCFPLALWSAGGLETSLMATVVVAWMGGAALLLGDVRPRAGLWLLSLSSLLAPVTRPEGLVLVGVYIALLYYWARTRRLRFPWVGPVVVVAVLCLLEAMRLSHFGRPLALPFYVKVDVGNTTRVISGLGYLHRFIWRCLGGALGYLAIIYAVCRSRPERAYRETIGVGLLSAAPWLLFIVVSGADWMPQWRFLVPIIAPGMVLVLGLGSTIAQALSTHNSTSRLFIAALTAAVLIGNIYGVFVAFTSNPWHSTRSDKIGFHIEATRLLLEQGEWLRRQGGPALLIAAEDVGAVGYISDARIIDLHGLTSPAVAGRDRAEVTDMVLAARPDYIQAYSHPLINSPTFSELYEPVPDVPWHLYRLRHK